MKVLILYGAADNGSGERIGAVRSRPAHMYSHEKRDRRTSLTDFTRLLLCAGPHPRVALEQPTDSYIGIIALLKSRGQGYLQGTTVRSHSRTTTME